MPRRRKHIGKVTAILTCLCVEYVYKLSDRALLSHRNARSMILPKTQNLIPAPTGSKSLTRQNSMTLGPRLKHVQMLWTRALRQKLNLSLSRLSRERWSSVPTEKTSSASFGPLATIMRKFTLVTTREKLQGAFDYVHSKKTQAIYISCMQFVPCNHFDIVEADPEK